MKLAAGIIVFRDCRSLKRTLDSLSNNVDIIYVIDGKFIDYQYHCDLSDDGTRELVQSYPNTKLVDYPASEVDKRNKYLECCREDKVDYLIIIDSDEWVKDADWKTFKENLGKLETINENILGLECYYNGTDTSVYPRLWKNPGDMEYYRCHNIFKYRCNGQLIRSPSEAGLVKGIRLAWDTSLRTEEHEQKTSEYQAKLIAKEKPIKRELFGGSR